VEWGEDILAKKLENGREAERDLALCLSHFNTEQIPALLKKLIFMIYLVLNRNDFFR